MFSTFFAVGAFAQDRPNDPAVSEDSLGDIMILVQLRHAKLWYAAKLGNWRLAAYEAERLSATLQRATRFRPDLPFADCNQVDLVADAIAATDEPSFDSAFRDMTDWCNSCHQAADVEFIAIRVPTRTSPYSNQVFGTP